MAAQCKHVGLIQILMVVFVILKLRRGTSLNRPCFRGKFCNLPWYPYRLASYVWYCLRSQGESIILEILKGYQAFTQVIIVYSKGFSAGCGKCILIVLRYLCWMIMYEKSLWCSFYWSANTTLMPSDLMLNVTQLYFTGMWSSSCCRAFKFFSCITLQVYNLYAWRSWKKEVYCPLKTILVTESENFLPIYLLL